MEAPVKDPNNPVVLTKPKKLLARLGDHVMKATMEMDNQTPSSARIYAGALVIFVVMIQVVIILALTWKLLRLDQYATQAPALAQVYASVFRSFILWTLLFDMGTALSLYGINIWKYIAALRTGRAIEEDDEGGKVQPTPQPVVSSNTDEEAAVVKPPVHPYRPSVTPVTPDAKPVIEDEDRC